MSEGKKHDQGKLRFDLINPNFEADMAKVLTHGAETYGENNWQEVLNAKARYTAALQRHLNEYRRGSNYDIASGCTHLAMIAVNAMFLDYFERLPYMPKELTNANKVLSASIDHRVLAAATGTKQDPPCGSPVDTASESQFDPYRYK